MNDNAKLCSRCQRDYFTPYGVERSESDPAPPAISRVDNVSEICSACGVDEAMRDFRNEEPIHPDAWPLRELS